MEKKKSENCIVIHDDYPRFPITYFSVSSGYEKYIKNVMIPHGLIKDRVEKLCMDIVDTLEADYAENITLMCVLKGGFKFFGELVEVIARIIRERNILMQMSVDFIRVKSYTNMKSNCEPVVTGTQSPDEYADKNIIIVEDIIDSGKSMRALLNHLKKIPSRSVRIASLLVKRTGDQSVIKPDFTGFEIPDEFVVGYALDYNEYFRDLHHLCILNEEGQKAFAVPSCLEKSQFD